jgi:uncharacterized protein (DUF885 family)
MRKLMLSLVVLSSIDAFAQELSASDLDRRRKALDDLLHEQWEYALRRAPELASILGDRRYNRELSDVSEAAAAADVAANRDFLRRFEGIGTLAFSDQERLNRDLMIRELRGSIQSAAFRGWLMPVDQMAGLHLNAAQLPSSLPFASVRDYDDYVIRLARLPKAFDDTIANMRKGMAAGLMPPRFLLQKVAEQAQGIADAPAGTSPFAVPLASFHAGVTDAERLQIRERVDEAIRRHVVPAYTKFARFVREEYAPRGRTEVGVWALPDGKQRYAHLVRQMTTTDMDPESIHQLGLREVARIEREMLQIARTMGHEDLASFDEAIDQSAALRARSGAELIGLYSKYIDQMYAKLPQLFGRLPKAALEVVPVPQYREESAAAASYEMGSPDGARPGRVFVNTWEATSRKLLTVESTSYHEGAPGHHMQLAIQQELNELPPFRQQGGQTAFIEGWALYSERLGKEVGFYEDPYSDYGRLNDEMLRAIRLVVDTGLHHKRWSREQVVEFFREHSAIDEVEIQSETDRYIVWPGQALAYKIGQLRILALRERAQRELGEAFDIRDFHDEVLGAGALPMQQLEERILGWIARTKKGQG